MSHKRVQDHIMPKERTIIPVVNVFTSSTLEKANHELDDFPMKENFNSGNTNIFRAATKLDELPYAFAYKDVSFDQHACVTEWADFKRLHLGSPNTADSITDMTQEGLEKMAQTLGFENKTVSMASNILCYKLSASNPHVKNMPWHQDGSGRQNITMTTVYTRSHQDGVSYTGGELGFRHVDYYRSFPGPGNRPIYQHSDRNNYMQLTEVQKQGLKFSYQENGGFVFDNTASEHKVHDISLCNPRQYPDAIVERRLFTIFTSLTVDQYTDAITHCDPHNLLSDEDTKILRADGGEDTQNQAVARNALLFSTAKPAKEPSASRQCAIAI
jgi:hypothetical protein